MVIDDRFSTRIYPSAQK